MYRQTLMHAFISFAGAKQTYPRFPKLCVSQVGSMKGAFQLSRGGLRSEHRSASNRSIGRSTRTHSFSRHGNLNLVRATDDRNVCHSRQPRRRCCRHIRTHDNSIHDKLIFRSCNHDRTELVPTEDCKFTLKHDFSVHCSRKHYFLVSSTYYMKLSIPNLPSKDTLVIN